MEGYTHTFDLLGRTIREERSGFSSVPSVQSVVTNSFFYNSKGQLVKTTTTGSAATLYEYNELGEQIRSGLDIDGDDALNLSGPDRVTESTSWYGRADFMSATNEWARFSASAVYVDGSSVPTTNSIQKTRLTGLGSVNEELGTLNQEQVAVDIYTNSTTSRTYINRSTTNMTQVVSYPDSSNDAVSVSANGLLVSSKTKTGLEYLYSYDGLERQTSVTDPRTGTSTTHYNDLGQVDYVEDAATNRTSFFYDPDSGRQIAVSNALGYVVNSQFDARGQLIGTWGATYPVAYDFDEFNRMSAMYTYRGASNISSYADILVVKPYMDKTQWKYDEATGLLTNKLYADNNGPGYEYTSDGKLSARIWARPKPGTTNEELRTTYSYTNTTGEMIGIGYSDSNATPSVTFTFNRLGQQVTVSDGQGARTFTYNDALQLAAETNVNGVISRQYDSFGRSSGFNLGNDYSVGYGYSDIGRFSSVSSSVQSVSSVVNYSYLANSDLLSGWGNGTVSVVKSYEPNRNLLTSVSNGVGATMISRFDYANDALGRRTQRIDSGSATATNQFAYNPKNEITNAVMGENAFAWTLDPIGNRISATKNQEPENYSANSLNQYTAITNGGLRTLAYDLDGNLTNDGHFAYTWDAENRLTSVVSNGTVIASFKYDYMSRRYEKATAAGTNTFLWDGWQPVCELGNPTTGNSTTNFYVWGLDLSQSLQGAGGIGGLLSVTKSEGAYFPVADGNGNITDYVDTNGAMMAHRGFDAYGNTIVASGAVDDFQFWFSSKYLDSESGLYYYGYRYYQPGTGRWLSRDPIEEQGGLSLCCFVKNEPITRIDKLGLVGPASAVDTMEPTGSPYGFHGLRTFAYDTLKVTCPDNRKALGSLWIVVGLDASATAAIGGMPEALPPALLEPGYIGVYFELYFEVSDQKALEECCCCDSAGWVQKKNDGTVLDDSGGFLGLSHDPPPFYQGRPQKRLVDFPGIAAGAWPVASQRQGFADYLHCAKKKNPSLSGLEQSHYKQLLIRGSTQPFKWGHQLRSTPGHFAVGLWLDEYSPALRRWTPPPPWPP